MAERVQELSPQRLRFIRGGGIDRLLFGGTVLVAGMYLLGGVVGVFPMDNLPPIRSPDALGLLAFGLLLAAAGGGAAFFKRWITLDLSRRHVVRRYGLGMERLSLRTQVFDLGAHPTLEVVHDAGDGDVSATDNLYLRCQVDAPPVLLYSTSSPADRKRTFLLVSRFLKGPHGP